MSNKRLWIRVNRLIKDIDRNKYQCIGKPEPLKEDLSGYWSARIDKQNRLVFRISVEDLIIVQCGMHYKDK